MIAFLCSACGKGLKVKDEFAGRKGKCPHCQQPMIVPDSSDTANEGASEAATVLPPSRIVERNLKSVPPSALRNSGIARKSSAAVSGGSAVSGDEAELTDFLAPPQEADEIGRLGPYRVLKVLGAGGMGVVFEAEDPKLHRRVALKAMLPALAASATNKDRFLREARSAAAIEHDRIVAIFQVDEDRGVPFLAMPLLKGESLEDCVRREGTLPLAEALRITREAAEGLAAAHERNMIHRDIKPANIWLEGDRRRVKILDFGLARTVQGGEQLTQQGMIIGTPQYMAPEQAAGKPVDTRCDLFSLGCVLYRMTTGQLAFAGSDTVATLVAVATQTPPAPRKLNPEISPRLSKLIMDLLAKKPEDRPPSALSVVDLIEEMEKEPASANQQIVVEEQVARVRVVREDREEAVRPAPARRREEEEEPARRSLLLPLLIAGGTLGILVLLGGLVIFLLVKSGDAQPELAQNNPPSITNPPINVPPPNQNKGPAVNPAANNPVPPTGNDPVRPPKSEDKEAGTSKPGDKEAPPPPPPPITLPKKEKESDAEKTFQAYSAPVKGLVFAPDGQRFFSFSDREPRIDYWELATRKNLRSFALTGGVRGCIVSADGSQVLAYNDNQLIAWESDGGGTPQPVTPLPGQKIIGGGFTSDKAFRVALAVRGEVGRGASRQVVGGVQIYDSAQRKLLLVDPAAKKKAQPIVLAPHNGEVLRAFFSPDGKKVVTWCQDHLFRLWDLEGKRLAATFAAAPGDAKSIAISTDFKKIMASFPQAGVRVYDVDSGREIKDFKPAGVGDTDAVAVGGDNNLGVTATFGGATRVYELEEAKVKRSVKGIPFTGALALSPDGKTLLCGDMSGKVHIYNVGD